LKFSEKREYNRDKTREQICIYLSATICTTFVGQQLSTGDRPWKTPLFDYSSTMAKEKPQEQGLAEMIFAHGARDKEPSGERESGREEERRGERGAKNEVKFIRVQTDVNLFKLRDFGNGWERRGWWGLLRCDGSGSICFITARDKGWAWIALAREKDSILREIKKSLSFRSRFFERGKACPVCDRYGGLDIISQ